MILSYHAPSSLTEALDYLRENGDVQIIAGGTDLLVQHYEKLDRLTGLLDLGKVAELKQITTGPQVWIGALVTHQEILDHPWLRAHVPILCQGAGEVAAPQIRNRGTLGGNLANASPAADMAPPLVVLEARVELAGPGAKSVPVQEFFTGPGGTVLAPGQIITGVSFPVPPANAGGCYIKLGRRKAMAIATASVAVQVEVADAKLKDIRICLGSVAPRPVRAGQTEALLRGQSLDALDLDQALAQLRAEISPIDDIRSTAEYRRQVAGVIFRRALFQAIKNAGVELDG
ncbi:MAG: FAD binding domain-containing protein [Bacillota bacterium]